ncbi:PQQ-dependent sugar dehydrogenase [Alteromonas aestuariivivens]|uniref:PQQ-dependent sugar dehydrogenase n=1 Tax=Alteromonas aestuariivivens TaxID=1938339 RepID=A0A3D8M9C6_9ALTE|nr:PQQ-dependent sugar dehydrogenase [Alteromonas aestuariivivens]RDV26643.1 PQQ-dependent sugar dehydrogenase [Alteromonas aestuariivivens]
MTKSFKKFGCLASMLGTVLFASSTFAASLNVKELAVGLSNPWGMVFLPDGDILLTERAGKIRRFDMQTGLGEPLAGVPEVAAVNQGGMLDIILDPGFSTNQTIYFCYSRPTEGGSSSSVARAKLGESSITDVTDIFIADSVADNGFHFGCRLAFDAQNALYASLGDRNFFKEEAQNTDNHFGTIVRIDTKGKPIADNPFIGGKAPEIFTYGHRNVQGLTIHPVTGEVWAMEHGPKGGDEVNKLAKGNNYGWPVITYGINYNGDIISDKTHMEGMEQPVLYWDPSIAPSGMTFYSGEAFKDWQGDLLVGALKFTHLRRIEMDGDTPGEQHEFLKERKERIRDVTVGPDGLIYLLTDSPEGKLLQVSPAE